MSAMTASPVVAEEEPPFDAWKAWTISTVVILGILMSMLDSTVVNVTLPTIMSVFNVAMSGVQWISTAYTLSMAIVIPLGPYMSRVFGPERVYMAALAIFTASSFLCGFSWSLNTLIVFRIIQAIGGGVMMPIGMGMVMTLFPPSKRGLAFGVFGVAMTAAPAFGPTLGGYVVDALGWRYVFYINVPIGIVAFFLGTMFFQFIKRNPFPRFDIVGFLSAGIGSSLLLYLLGQNTSIDWTDPKYIYMTILGVGGIVFFLINELLIDEPLLDLRLLKNRNYSVSMILSIIQTLMMMSIAYTTPIFLQDFKGMSAMESGEVLLPSSLVMALFMPIAGRITDMAGPRMTKWVIAIGITICGASTFWMSSLMHIDASITDIIIASSIRNIGLGISMMPVQTMGLFSIPVKDSQRATALQTFIRQYSSSITVALVTFSVTSRFDSNYANAAAQLTPFNQPLNNLIAQLSPMLTAGGVPAGSSSQEVLSLVVGQLYEQNYVLAIQYTIFTFAIVGMFALVMVPFFKIAHKPKPGAVPNPSAEPQGAVAGA